MMYKKQGSGLDSWVIDNQLQFNIDVLSWKLKAVLIQRGLFSQVETALNGLPEPNKSIALLAWNGSPTISITSNTTKFVQSALCLTIEQVTEIFADAYDLDI